ncbi:hypothetical protein [Orrella daihaiensis]|uniref:Uncharacterized protein n=1 Tax=Orrella daihaiensis TaxID=2782176 RepID=A0ABY4AMQ7_9BURK|nr:hypothetical protein [Orrella daihaiensis]UOD51323.1 hypothetical protein DHf2319_05660 [Orrella daihaiensis]
MSIENEAVNQKSAHSLDEITKILIKHHDYHDGFFEIYFELNMAVGSFDGPGTTPLPGAAVTFAKIGIKRVTDPGPCAVDASKVNPSTKKNVSVKKLKK